MSIKEIGWICPACGKGNAPFALKCGHCKDFSSSPYTGNKNHVKLSQCNCPGMCVFHTKIG